MDLKEKGFKNGKLFKESNLSQRCSDEFEINLEKILLDLCQDLQSLLEACHLLCRRLFLEATKLNIKLEIEMLDHFWLMLRYKCACYI